MEWIVTFPKEPVLMSRPSLRKACGGNRNAAKLLSHLLYRVSVRENAKVEAERINELRRAQGREPDQDTSTSICRTQPQLVEEMDDEVSDRTLRDDAIPCLKELGFLFTEEIKGNRQYTIYTLDVDAVQEAINHPESIPDYRTLPYFRTLNSKRKAKWQKSGIVSERKRFRAETTPDGPETLPDGPETIPGGRAQGSGIVSGPENGSKGAQQAGSNNIPERPKNKESNDKNNDKSVGRDSQTLDDSGSSEPTRAPSQTYLENCENCDTPAVFECPECGTFLCGHHEKGHTHAHHQLPAGRNSGSTHSRDNHSQQEIVGDVRGTTPDQQQSVDQAQAGRHERADHGSAQLRPQQGQVNAHVSGTNAARAGAAHAADNRVAQDMQAAECAAGSVNDTQSQLPTSQQGYPQAGAQVRGSVRPTLVASNAPLFAPVGTSNRAQFTELGRQVCEWYEIIQATKVRRTNVNINACNGLAEEDGMSFENLKLAIEHWEAHSYVKERNIPIDLQKLEDPSGAFTFAKAMLAIKAAQRMAARRMTTQHTTVLPSHHSQTDDEYYASLRRTRA